mgnify:CR=1 FL=1
MNVTMEKNGSVGGIITVSLEEKDYQEKVSKDLKTIGLKHRVDGFRPGKVPAGILKKMFGKQVLADVLNRETVDALFKYIEDEKLSILGEPLSVDTTELDFSQKDYTFKFEVGLAPEISLEVNKDLTIPYYTIKVDDDMVKRQDEAFARRFGSQVPGESVDETALVKGAVVELNEDGSVKENGIVTNTIVSMEYISTTGEKEKFLGKKVGDKVVFNPAAASKGSAAEVASMLNIDKEQAENVKADFEFEIKEIIVLKLAEKNQEFFDNVFGKDAVTDASQYETKLKEMIATQLMLDSNYRFTLDAQAVIMEKVGNLELPVEFLKKWLKKTNEKINDENVDAEFEKMLPAAEWQLVKEKIAKNFGVKVEEEDLKREAKVLAAQQFAQYGMANVPDEYLEKYANDFLENKEYRQRLIEKAVEDKLFAAVKEAVTIEAKDVTVAEFNDLFKA